MNDRTRANTPAEGQTRTDIDKEPGEWVEAAQDESMDKEALSGSREGDQVTDGMSDEEPSESGKDDFGDHSDPDKKVNEERPHSPRSSTQR